LIGATARGILPKGGIIEVPTGAVQATKDDADEHARPTVGFAVLVFARISEDDSGSDVILGISA